MMKAFLGALLVFLLGTAIIGAYLAPDDLVRCGSAPSNLAGCEKVDAIVAVSGGHTQARTAEAVALYQAGWSDRIIFSGAAFDTDAPSNASVMKEEAIKSGVPAGNIIIEESSRTTHENAKKTESILSQYKLEKIIVVTSPYHQRRAGIEFSTIAGNDVLVLNHPASNDPDWGWFWWLTPRGWWLAVGELVKIGATHAGESR